MRPAVTPGWRGNNASPSPIKKLISGHFSRDPHFPVLLFHLALLPCAGLRLLLFYWAAQAHAPRLGLCCQWFAVAQMAPAQTGTHWAGGLLSCCPSTPRAARAASRHRTFHCIQNGLFRAAAIREPGWSDLHICSVTPGRLQPAKIRISLGLVQPADPEGAGGRGTEEAAAASSCSLPGSPLSFSRVCLFLAVKERRIKSFPC